MSIPISQFIPPPCPPTPMSTHLFSISASHLPWEKVVCITFLGFMCKHARLLQSCQTNFETLWSIARRLLCPWASPGNNTRVGCHALLQRIFPTQGSICVNIQCLFFWRSSLCMTVHPCLYKWPNYVPFNGWIVFHCDTWVDKEDVVYI